MKIKNILYFGLLVLILATACSESYFPKPRAYFRISFPEKKYRLFDSAYPYKFEVPVYSTIKADSGILTEAYWLNISFPKYKAKIYISYKKINKNLKNYIEDSRNFAYKHSAKADAIEDKLFVNDSAKTYGILYDIKGNTASSVQFFVTDSIKHFIRGSLYFYAHPNKDSLAPAIQFFKADIFKLIETLRWKKN